MPYSASVWSWVKRSWVAAGTATTSDLSTSAWRWSARSAAAMRRVGADRLGGGQIAPAGEHRQPFEHPLLVVEEQLVAPVDHGPQRLLARQRGARPAGEQAEPIVQARRGSAERERSGAGGRELDGERQTVEAGADVGDHRVVVVGEFERRAGGVSPGDEEAHGVVGRERRHRPDGLAADAQSLAARGEDAQRRAATQQVLGDLGGRGDHVLAVVEHDQHARGHRSARPTGSGPGARGRRRSAPGLRPGSPTGASSTRQPPNARSRGHGAGHLQREAVLPTPPGPTSVTNRCVGEQLLEVAAARRRVRPTGSALPGSSSAVRREAPRCASTTGGGVERPVLGQDRGLQLAELVTGFEPELLTEKLTAVLEHAERVGLPAGAVQREHQQPAEPLAQRMRRDELLELRRSPPGGDRAGARCRAAPRSR